MGASVCAVSGDGLAAELALGELTDNIRRLVAAASSASVGGGTSGVFSRDSVSEAESISIEQRIRFVSGSLSSSEESRACFLQSGGVWTGDRELGWEMCLDLCMTISLDC